MKRSLLCLVVAPVLSTAHAQTFSWQQPQAKVLPTGTLEWSPRPFVFEKGASIKYVDFASGNDSNPGTKEKPWQHHPWDNAATGLAKECTGIHTYVFKRGVIYRGELRSAESGEKGNPIRLTSDPNWGTGEATFYGSVRIPGTWKKCTAEDAPGIPEPEKVWFNDLGEKFDTDGKNTKMSAIWRLKGDTAVRLHIARDPNWSLSNANDPAADWYRWDSFQGFQNHGFLADPDHWAGKDPSFFEGAEIWTEHRGLMGTPHRVRFEEFNSEKGAFKVNSPGGATYTRHGGTGPTPFKLQGRVRYYIENVRGFLDSPGEYYFDIRAASKGRLYLRLDDDSDPNKAVLEAAQVRSPIQIFDQNHIVVSGLMFRFNDDDDGKYGYPWFISASPGVRIVGRCEDITVKNCKFYNVMNAVVAFPRPSGTGGPAQASQRDIGSFADDVMDDIAITDNDVRDNDMQGAIWVNGASERTPGEKFGILKRVEVMRNRVVNSGYRPGKSSTSSIPAISVCVAETAEIAGNIVDTSWGNGIFTLSGKTTGAVNDVPLTRMLMYQNQADNTMLGCNDYGGLELFQGGPAYIFNNVSRNTLGTKTFTGTPLGYNLYLDGAFKVYSFNNILGGKIDPASHANHCGYFMVFGFMDHFFNNTIHGFEYGVNGSSGNRSCVLGNIIADCTKSFLAQNRAGDASMMGGNDTGEMGRIGIPTMAYGSNIFWGKPSGDRNGEGAFGMVGGVSAAGGKAEVHQGKTLDELRSALESMNCRVNSLGQQVDEMPLRDPSNGDYRPKTDGAVRDAGAKFFVPWGLARTVGEWNFYKSESAPGIVLGENFYMQEELIERSMYYHVPRNDLAVSSATPADYIAGSLEDWIEGALQFDGKSRVATLTHAEMTRDMVYPLAVIDGKVQKNTGNIAYSGSQRRTLDFDTNNFLIEAYFKTEPGHTGGTIAEKMHQTGYRLQVNAQGAVALTAGTSTVAGGKVNDGTWHHVLAEVDRAAKKAKIYVDGKATGDGTVAEGSLANNGDFVVGRGFAGAIDFLRVCRATLADSKTSIEELYAWEFSGPQFRDFGGSLPVGKRDAGALEIVK